jgi:hypothetical protein
VWRISAYQRLRMVGGGVKLIPDACSTAALSKKVGQAVSTGAFLTFLE